MSILDESKLKRAAIEYWKLKPGNRLVKLVGILAAHRQDEPASAVQPMFWTEGYVTCYKFVGGRFLHEAVEILGLRPHEFLGGAYVFELLALPTEEQFELRGYSQSPGMPDYPIGLGAAQWQITRNSFIPSRLAAIVEPGARLP